MSARPRSCPRLVPSPSASHSRDSRMPWNWKRPLDASGGGPWRRRPRWGGSLPRRIFAVQLEAAAQALALQVVRRRPGLVIDVGVQVVGRDVLHAQLSWPSDRPWPSPGVRRRGRPAAASPGPCRTPCPPLAPARPAGSSPAPARPRRRDAGPRRRPRPPRIGSETAPVTSPWYSDVFTSVALSRSPSKSHLKDSESTLNWSSVRSEAFAVPDAVTASGLSVPLRSAVSVRGALDRERRPEVRVQALDRRQVRTAQRERAR